MSKAKHKLLNALNGFLAAAILAPFLIFIFVVYSGNTQREFYRFQLAKSATKIAQKFGYTPSISCAPGDEPIVVQPLIEQGSNFVWNEQTSTNELQQNVWHRISFYGAKEPALNCKKLSALISPKTSGKSATFRVTTNILGVTIYEIHSGKISITSNDADAYIGLYILNFGTIYVRTSVVSKIEIDIRGSTQYISLNSTATSINSDAIYMEYDPILEPKIQTILTWSAKSSTKIHLSTGHERLIHAHKSFSLSIR